MSTATTDPVASVVDAAAALRAVEETLVGLAPELVPERIAKQRLAPVLRSLGRIERCPGGARIVLTKAAADAGAWKAQGFRSPAEWAARSNGTSVGQAQADLEASGQLEHLPATRDAAASGELSTDATKAVAAGATADRSAEQGLLAKGTAGDLTGARDGARRRADDRDGKAAARMYRRRQLRAWVEVDGEGRGQWNVPPAYQATFLAALEPYRKEAFRQAHAAGQRPGPEALMADALQLLCLDTLHDLDLPIPEAARGHHGPTHGSPEPGADATGAPPRSGGNGPAPEGPTPDAPTEPGPAAPGTTDPTHTGDHHPSDVPPDPTGSGDPGDPTDSGDSADSGDPGDPGDLSIRGVGGADGGGDRRPPSPTVEPDLFDGAATRSPGSATGRATSRPEKAPRYRRRAPAQIHFHLDVAAWLRDHPEGNDICEIPGLGPVPVSLVKAFRNDATLKLVLRNGDDITTITSNRRYIPAALRTALEARDHECVAPGCHVTRGLQIDHIHDFHKGGPTELVNNALLCVFHHYLKTHCHWILRGPPGRWTFTPPDTS